MLTPPGSADAHLQPEKCCIQLMHVQPAQTSGVTAAAAAFIVAVAATRWSGSMQAPNVPDKHGQMRHR